MASPQDPLIKRLTRIKKSDILEILVAGLSVSPEAVQKLDKKDLILHCSKEVRAAAGSSTANVFRDDHDFPYKQLLIDVADKLTPGHTIFSWTDYTMDDDHSVEEIEDAIVKIFEERTKKWWMNLSAEEKAEFTKGIKNAADPDEVKSVAGTGAVKSFLTQQVIENIIQGGIMSGLGKVGAGGVMGAVGVSLVAKIGWLVVLQTVGWMSGVKFLAFGVAGHGAMGGAVAGVGGLVVGGVLSIPTLFALVDGAAYRKTVPTVILLLTKYRLAKAAS